MQRSTLTTILLVAVVALSTTTAYASSIDGTAALESQGTLAAQEQNTTTSASGSSAESGEQNSGTSAEDYTKLYVDSDHRYLELKPGETGTVNVTVENAEESAVTVNPHLYVPPAGGREKRVEQSWLSIDGETTVDAGEERTFTVTISVPEDANAGHYGGQLAFTNETVTYPGRPARPVHAAHVNVEVWQEPTVTIVSNEYLRGQLKAGDSLTRQIVIKNSGEQAVPVNPQYPARRDGYHGGSTSQLDPSWVDIDAPNQIGAGETATVTVTISPPADVKNGRYRGELDLGLKDPARPERSNYWQRINMHVEVWSQPAEPFSTSVSVSEETRNISLTLSPRSNYLSGSSDREAGFDVVFVSPNGDRIDADRVTRTDRGFVDLSAQERSNAVQTHGEYAVRGTSGEFVYRVPDPAAGEWTVEIMPRNTIGFNYEIVRHETVDSPANGTA